MALGTMVCPTYVGMNRHCPSLFRRHRRMPHVCGDEPVAAIPGTPPSYVCPTYVGMNRGHDGHPPGDGGMPHVGGDEPSIDIGEYVAP